MQNLQNFECGPLPVASTGGAMVMVTETRQLPLFVQWSGVPDCTLPHPLYLFRNVVPKECGSFRIKYYTVSRDAQLSSAGLYLLLHCTRVDTGTRTKENREEASASSQYHESRYSVLAECVQS